MLVLTLSLVDFYLWFFKKTVTLTALNKQTPLNLNQDYYSATLSTLPNRVRSAYTLRNKLISGKMKLRGSILLKAMVKNSAHNNQAYKLFVK